MDNYIIDILSKISSGDINNISQKELLLAMVYEQRLLNEKLEDMAEDINELKSKNVDQDENTIVLKEKVNKLEKKLDEELIKKQARAQALGWIATGVSVVATIIATWSRLSGKLGLIIYKTGLWGF